MLNRSLRLGRVILALCMCILLLSAPVAAAAQLRRPGAMSRSAGQAPARAAAQRAPRRRSLQAIRQALSELDYALATGQADAIQRLTTQRTRELLRRCFALLAARSAALTDEVELPDVPMAAEDLPDLSFPSEAHSGAALFAFTLGVMARMTREGNTAEESRRQAQARAARARVTFVDNRMARIEIDGEPPLLALREAGRWKIDMTEALKSGFLELEILTPEERAHIRNY